MSNKKAIGLWEGISIGIGAMIGAGIFSILGVIGQISGNALWVSFIIAGLVALLNAYNLAKMGARYPSAGGLAEFLVRGFGDGVLSGGFNILLLIGQVFALALYSRAFAEYGMTFLPTPSPPILVNILIAAVIFFFTAINFIGANAVGQSEKIIVAVKVAILLLFVSAGVFFIKPELLSPALWPSGSNIFFGAAMAFVTYQGVGLITNAAEDMRTPQKTLPRAIFLSIGIVIIIYAAISVAVIGNLPIPQLIMARDYALAQAAQPFLGTAGFKIIALAALFSTASGINATLYGGANVSYALARDGQLPALFKRKVWGMGTEGLFITAGLTLLFANFFDLRGIAGMASEAALLLMAAGSIAHLRLYKETGARPSIIVASITPILAFFGAIVYYQESTAPFALTTLIITLSSCFVAEGMYRRLSHRTIITRI